MSRAVVMGFVLTVCAALAGCAPVPSTAYTELVYATPYGPGHPFSRADIEWMQYVERASHGRLRIKPSWSGALLSSEHSMVELRHGVADIGLVTPIYVKAGVHLIRVQSGFYSGADTVEKQLALYRCMAAAHPRFDEEMQGLHVLAVQGGTLPGLLTRERPVHKLADVRGLRIRAPTELLSVLRHLGADPVNMPMGEVYSALAKGVIDGVIASGDTFRSLHFAEVAHHFTFLAVPRGAYPARAMSQKRWARLTDDDRKVLDDGRPVWEAALARQTAAAQDGGFAEGRKAGVEFIEIDPAEQAAFDRLYLDDAGHNAAALARYGIDGAAVFDTARASVRDGTIACPVKG